MATSLIVTEKPYVGRATVYHEEDWHDAIPQLVSPVTGDPYDLAACVLQIFIRPTFGHTTAIKLLTSTASTGPRIIRDNVSLGLASIFMPKADVQLMPTGEWEHFCLLFFTDADLGTLSKTLWRGPLIIRPGRTT